MQYDHVVTLTCESVIGLDRYDPSQWTVCSARALLPLIEKPASDNSIMSDVALRRHEEALEFLRALEDSAVMVSPFGCVVGEYQVSPYVITMKEYKLLEGVP